MTIVAGSPGGGKSSRFPVKSVGVDWFNSDDWAAQRNPEAYRNISPALRAAAGEQLKDFIDSHIAARQSFAFENALRTTSGFEQIRAAKRMGFRILMDYIAAGPVEEHIRRVMNRAALGGHSASERKLRDIYSNSMRNLVIAFEENREQQIDLLRIFDNSKEGGVPRMVLSLFRGIPRRIAPPIPAWLDAALAGSPFEIETLRTLARSRGGI